ncbi:MAG: HAD-IB family phosphatase [Polyangiaceae bacterium]|nr:HAD-IB family phosphatase [Polyangiaceae bacterium]
MRTVSVEEVLSVIQGHVHEAPGGVLAFDGDGTLWSGDIGNDFFFALLESEKLEPLAHEALTAEARAQCIDVSGTAVEIARRIYDAYLADRFPEERICEIMTWACAGWTRDRLDAFAAGVMARLSLDDRFHREAHRVLTWAREHGVAVYLVSASPRAIVEQAARLVGIDRDRVIAATEHRGDDDVVRSEVRRPIPYGRGKVTRLREKLGARTLYAAFGDNVFDIPMLCEARLAVAVHPKPLLIERAAEVPGIVVLARGDDSFTQT